MKLEYLVLTVSNGKPTAVKGPNPNAKLAVEESLDSKTLPQVLNELGNDEWNVVGIQHEAGPSAREYSYILNRAARGVAETETKREGSR